MAAISTIVGLSLAAAASAYGASEQRKGQAAAVAQAERQAAEQKRQYEETARKAQEQAAETAKQAAIQMATEQQKEQVAQQIKLQTEADLARQATLAEDAGLDTTQPTSARKRRTAYQGAIGGASVSTGDTTAAPAVAGSIRV